MRFLGAYGMVFTECGGSYMVMDFGSLDVAAKKGE